MGVSALLFAGCTTPTIVWCASMGDVDARMMLPSLVPMQW